MLKNRRHPAPLPGRLEGLESAFVGSEAERRPKKNEFGPLCKPQKANGKEWGGSSRDYADFEVRYSTT